MIYQLTSGKVIEISIEQYIHMTDEDIEYFIAYEVCEFYENPFSNSALNDKNVIDDIYDPIDQVYNDKSLDIDDDLLEE